MNAYQNNEQNEQSVDAKVPYEAPAVTVMGKVEQLTAIFDNGTPDLVSHGNIL